MVETQIVTDFIDFDELGRGVWHKDSVYDGLRARRIALVNVDEPELPRLPKATGIVTTDFAYIRFHGRNKANWWTGDSAGRYDYLYDRGELLSWLPLIKTIAQQVRLLLISFNNHRRGQAVQNARDLRQLLLFSKV